MEAYDAIIIGSGPNALVNAALLAKNGWSVLVLEKRDRPGGGLRTEELTLPGFLHDVYAGYLILFAASAAYAELGLDLQARGLELIHSNVPAGLSMPGGQAAILTTSMEANIAQAEKFAPGDGQAWAEAIQNIGKYAPSVFQLLASDLSSSNSLATIKELMLDSEGIFSPFATQFLETARNYLESRFKSEVWRGMLAPWVFHTGHGPEDANSGFWTQIFALGCQSVGQFVSVGGSEMLAKSLVKLIEDNGGKIYTNTTVDYVAIREGKAVGVRTESGEKYQANRAVIACTTPEQLYLKLLSHSPLVTPLLKQQSNSYRYGHSVLAIHLALNEDPQWHDEILNEAIYTHITSGLDGVSLNYNETTRRLLPSDPVVGVGVPTLLDRTRAPEGKAVMVLQALDVPFEFSGDAAGKIDVGNGTWTEDVKNYFTDRVIDIASQHIPNLKDSILARAIVSPLDLAKANPNWKYGDPYSGAHDLAQSYLLRPMSGQPTHHTPIPHLYNIGASTFPGLGLGSNSGYILAQFLLKRWAKQTTTRN
jgi:phytoene dehydrogenase-like protein